MTPKATKIVDIQAPSQVSASASGRPLLVANRPVMARDPMVTASDDVVAQNKPAEPITRTAKIIKPLEPDAASSEPEDQTEMSAPPANPTASATNLAEERETQPSAETAPVPVDDKDDGEPEVARDAAAEAAATESKAEEARMARDAELERLVASGKYFVPINAVQRKRSRTYVLLLCASALLFGVVLLDVILDMGLVKLPLSLPHTNFFQ